MSSTNGSANGFHGDPIVLVRIAFLDYGARDGWRLGPNEPTPAAVQSRSGIPSARPEPSSP